VVVISVLLPTVLCFTPHVQLLCDMQSRLAYMDGGVLNVSCGILSFAPVISLLRAFPIANLVKFVLCFSKCNAVLHQTLDCLPVLYQTNHCRFAIGSCQDCGQVNYSRWHIAGPHCYFVLYSSRLLRPVTVTAASVSRPI
jgi:hypothetical protein